MGRLKDQTHGYNVGLMTLAGILLIEAAVVLALRLTSKEKPA
jgi:hypothetical protein